jgi:hypothetical protein
MFNFHVLRSQTHFGRSRERRVQFSSFVLPDSFWAVPRALGPLYMFCAPGPVLGGIEGVGSSFHVLRSQTHFRRYQGRRVPFSYFALSDSFSVVPRVLGPFLMFCALLLIVGGTEGVESQFIFYALGLFFGSSEGVGSRFHVLRSRCHFGRYRGRRVQLSCFALPDSFSSVPRASGPVFMF